MKLSRSGLLCALQLASSALCTAAGLAPGPAPAVLPRHGGGGGGGGGCSSSCKSVPGTPRWPSPQEWARFNESLAGRLLQPSPPGAVCHPGQAAYDPAKCAAVRAGWSTYEFHQADPVSMDWNQWANDSCLPLEGAPCSGRGYPLFVVNASEARHVQLGVRFARKHNIRLVVKSSGHDYVGRSNAPNSLSIWTHHLKGIQPHDSFRPRQCKVTIDSPAVTVGAGTQMWDLYSALDPLNQTVVGGGGKTVSVGGYVTGAGHSLLSAWYGLAADQVLEMEVVTPKGDLVVANECQNQDLFWAMRGGGGSTFGVLTSITMKTYPTPRIEHLLVAIATTNISETRAIFDMVAYVLSEFPSLGDQGLSGYSYFFPTFPNPFDGGNTTVGGLFMVAALKDSSPAAMAQLWAPVLARVNASWPGLFQTVYIPASYPSFLAWYSVNFDTSATGLNVYTGSRLLDRAALTGNLTRNADALARFAGGEIGTAYLVSGKGVRDARPRGGGNAVLPAWRMAYVHATTSVLVPPLDPAADLAGRKRLKERVAALKAIAPDMGAYVNEANFEEPDFQHEFWGSNYERLLRIKRALDPDDVFWCQPCVGNERWQPVGDRLCRVGGGKH